MTLYFETEGQGAAFLLLCAMGFLLAAAFDARRLVLGRHLKPLGDVAAFLLAATAFVFALFVLREDEIRLYHWLALVTGAVLYLCGLRRAARRLLLRARRGAKPAPDAGISSKGAKKAGKARPLSNMSASKATERRNDHAR